MSVTAVLAAIGALGAIVTGIVYLVKSGIWIFKATPAQTDAKIDQANEDAKHKAEQSGRPQ